MNKSNHYISTISLHDFKRDITEQLEYVETTPTDNEWTFDEIENACHVVTTSSSEGFVKRVIGKVYAGDVITLNAEFKSISGENPRLTVDWFSDENLTLNRKTDFIRSKQIDGYNKTTFTYTVLEDGYIQVHFGLWRSHIGEFKLRKLKCLIRSDIDYKNGSWKDVDLSDGWENIDATGNSDIKAQYKKEGNRVYVRGSVRQIESQDNTTILNLPGYCRPKTRHHTNIVAVQDGGDILILQLRHRELLVRFGVIELNRWVSFNFYYDVD